MKFHILFEFREGPWGGGNQFLKALRDEFKSQNIYEEHPDKSDVILFNCNPSSVENLFGQLFRTKQRYNNKIIIFRIDGPVSLIRGKDREIDKIIAQANNLFSDGVIFQSYWCRNQNRKLFNFSLKYEIVIYNAPDNKIFSRRSKCHLAPNQKIKLIASSWSANWRKGFNVYKFLDESLDFSKYEMTFVGNSPIIFKNIKQIKPVTSQVLADILKKHDIFVTASRNDPCSNALIEALSCGLPAVGYNDGGHAELIGQGGEVFDRNEEILEKIERVSNDYEVYQNNISGFYINTIAKEYYKFAYSIYNDVQKGRFKPERVSLLAIINFYLIKFMILKRKVLNTLRNKLIFKLSRSN